jgi:tetratricopeptide (TPR) repeat protein
MERYEQALADLDKTIVLVENNSWLFAQRGETYRLMDRYEEALTDLDRAIALDEKYTWALTSRGRTYRHMGRYGEALTDLDKAIALDESGDWQWYGKALICLLTDQQALFHKSLHVALDLVHSRIERLTNHNAKCYRIRFNAALYLLVDGSTETSEADYLQLLSVCSVVSLLQGAATDLEEFLAIQPENELAQNILTLVQKRIEEVG